MQKRKVLGSREEGLSYGTRNGKSSLHEARVNGLLMLTSLNWSS